MPRREGQLMDAVEADVAAEDAGLLMLERIVGEGDGDPVVAGVVQLVVPANCAHILQVGAGDWGAADDGRA